MLLHLFSSLIFLAAIVVLVCLVVVVRRAPGLGVWVLLVSAALEATSFTPSLEVSGIRISMLDTATVVLAGVLVAQVTTNRRLGWQPWSLGVLLGASIVRGLGSFGIEQTFNSARPLIYLIVAFAFSRAMAGEDAGEVFVRVWRTVAVALCLVAAAFLAAEGLGTYAATGVRALNAAQAMLVAQAAVIMLVVGSRRRDTALALTMLGVVMLSQQRTVWAATIIMVTAIVLRSGRLRTTGATRALRLTLIVAAVLVVGLIVAAPDDLRASTEVAVADASAASGTFGWRIEGWVDLVERYGDGPLEDRVLGRPAGTGYDREVRGVTVSVSPHNMYITMLLSFGAIGLLAYCHLLLSALRNAWASVLLVALLAGLVVYGISYQLMPEHGLILGWCLAEGTRTRPTLPGVREPDAPDVTLESYGRYRGPSNLSRSTGRARTTSH